MKKTLVKAGTYFVFLMCFILSAGCSGKQKAEVGPDNVETRLEPPYLVDLEACVKGPVQEMNLSEISDDIRYIPLETKPENLIKRIWQIVRYDDRILINGLTSLDMFSSDGRFVKKIGQRGNGPEDYTYINGLVPDLDRGKFYIYTGPKINIYDRQLNFLKSVQLSDKDDRMSFGIMMPDGNIISYLGSKYKVIGSTNTIYSFAETDTLGQILRKYPNNFPIESTYPGMVMGEIPFYKKNGFVRYLDYGNDTLFSLSPEKEITPYAICPLGTMKRETNTAGFKSPEEYNRLADKLLVESVVETENHLGYKIPWGWDTGKSQYAMFDKRDGGLRNIGDKGLNNDIDGGIPFFPIRIEEDGTMISWMQAEDFIEQVKALDYDVQKEKYGERFETLLKLAEGMNPDDNPVLIVVKANK